MATLFIPNRNFGSDMMQDADTQDAMAKVAEGAVPMIEANVRSASGPWMPRTGHEPIEVQTFDGHVYIVNTDHAGHLMEFGTARNPPSAPLRLGAMAAGLRVESSDTDAE